MSKKQHTDAQKRGSSFQEYPAPQCLLPAASLQWELLLAVGCKMQAKGYWVLPLYEWTGVVSMFVVLISCHKSTTLKLWLIVSILYCSENGESLLVQDLLRSTNVHLLRGCIQLAKLLTKNTDYKNCMSAKDTFHT